MSDNDYQPPSAEFAGRRFGAAELGIQPAETLTLNGGGTLALRQPPAGFVYRDDLGLLVSARAVTQRVHGWPLPHSFAEPQRACITPAGDYLMVLCGGRSHQWGKVEKVNALLAYRSRNRGATWEGPTLPWDVPYSQHAWNPIVPPGSKRIYATGTEFVPERVVLPHNAPLPLRYSDDDGYTWSPLRFIRPTNFPDFCGVGHMQGCVTDAGTWLVGSYTIALNIKGERVDHQFILRSTDQGATWTLLPDTPPGGWFLPEHDRLMEGQVVNVGSGELLFVTRTPVGFIYEQRSFDDGQTWTTPAPTTMIHPDAPPMVFRLTDGRLVSFIHNCPPAKRGVGAAASGDRAELWACLSEDRGRTWSEPRFLLANAAPGFGNREVSYADLLVDGDDLHLFFDHGKRQVIQVHLKTADLAQLPTRAELWV